jgi:hypothetical protein
MAEERTKSKGQTAKLYDEDEVRFEGFDAGTTTSEGACIV